MKETLRHFPLRLRYALIARIGSARLFSAPPRGTPPPPTRIPELYRRIVRRLDLAGADALDKAKCIADYLSLGHRGRCLSTHLTAALRGIQRHCGGCCSDYAQVYTGLCAAAGIPAREWGLCDSFTSMQVGHCFNEVFSAQHRKWVMIDPFLSLVPTSGGTPLGVTELIDHVEAGRAEDIDFQLIDDTQRAMAAGLVPYYYTTPGNLYFLTGHYNVFEEDRMLRMFRWLPTSLRHSLLLLVGRYHRFWLYTNAANRARVEQAIGAVKTLKYLALGH